MLLVALVATFLLAMFALTGEWPHNGAGWMGWMFCLVLLAEIFNALMAKCTGKDENGDDLPPRE